MIIWPAFSTSPVRPVWESPAPSLDAVSRSFPSTSTPIPRSLAVNPHRSCCIQQEPHFSPLLSAQYPDSPNEVLTILTNIRILFFFGKKQRKRCAVFYKVDEKGLSSEFRSKDGRKVDAGRAKGRVSTSRAGLALTMVLTALCPEQRLNSRADSPGDGASVTGSLGVRD